MKWYGYFDQPTLGPSLLSKWNYLRDSYVVPSWGKKREERAGSAGATARVIIECTEPVELKVQPYRRRGWIVLPVGRSIVLGPQSIEGIYLPYKIQHEGSTIFWDCLFNKPVRVWPKLRSDGQFGILLHNLSSEPVHITPCTGVIMF